jgi:hypothetical protein
MALLLYRLQKLQKLSGLIQVRGTTLPYTIPSLYELVAHGFPWLRSRTWFLSDVTVVLNYGYRYISLV